MLYSTTEGVSCVINTAKSANNVCWTVYHLQISPDQLSDMVPCYGHYRACMTKHRAPHVMSKGLAFFRVNFLGLLYGKK